MKKYYKLSKIRNSKGDKVEYLQIWEGEAKGRGSMLLQVGTAEKLNNILVNMKFYLEMTKKYPKLVTKLLEEMKRKKD